MKDDDLVINVIASEARQSLCYNPLKTIDCRVTLFLAMTVSGLFTRVSIMKDEGNTLEV